MNFALEDPSQSVLSPGRNNLTVPRGRTGGRPPALTEDQKIEVRRMRDVERRPLPDIAALFRVSTKTVRRA